MDNKGNDQFDDYNKFIERRRKTNSNSRVGTLSEDELKKLIKSEVKKSKSSNVIWKVITVILILISIFLLSQVFTFRKMPNNSQNGSQGENKVVTIESEDTTAENAVAEKALDSVVGITTIGTRQNLIFNMDELVQGVGSGVVVSKDGYILTNSHVVQDGTVNDIEVLLTNGDRGKAKLLWNDSTLDLAVIKVEMTGLKPVEMGNSEDVKIGDKAIAIGNPLGLDLQSTLTSGYISGMNRTIKVEGNSQMDGLMQTDAAINSGNSGGGLFNSEGKLIGINTAKANADGIGFAIPVNVAKSVVDNIIKGGTYEGVALGIKGIDVKTYQQATGQKLPTDEGIFVAGVVQGLAADKAGIKEGDVITDINGNKISTMSQLKQELLKYRPGDKGKIRVNRNGSEKNLNIEFKSANAQS
ncbi:MAG: trypsin-like peptidase domain-containing protein [Finegoldia sp.]|nr:trypsin-like peptidase domain-containing protein [Finegoldia sp.]